MKKLIKRITATKGYRTAEAIAIFPLQVIGFVFTNTIGLMLFKLGEKIRKEA